ncbi:pyocin immunity protein [Brenneria roseae subsp. roseae]|uniref:DUF6392 family protein n=1 Tax=Brenneria roseae TaxID=1509241 RepID=UPI000D612000|nr:DUF6392 family protein [Brenneria roseae]PWC17626.1 pyocin immunity protein [Brenneria roseae subsp. roseae]
MSVNIEALIDCLGGTYQEIFDAGLIPYKTKPTGFSGSSSISLDMAEEGIYLSFNRNEKTLNEITLIISNKKKKGYYFSNKLPHPLKNLMSRSWIQEQFGEPCKFLPPRKRLKRDIGYTDLYHLTNYSLLVSMQIDYDLNETVEAITYLPTPMVRW